MYLVSSTLLGSEPEHRAFNDFGKAVTAYRDSYNFYAGMYDVGYTYDHDPFRSANFTEDCKLVAMVRMTEVEVEK